MTSPVFPAIHLSHLDEVALPEMYRVRLRQPDDPPLADPAQTVLDALDARSDLFDLPPGSDVAVAVGSRGIADIALVARTAVDWLKDKGFAPFIVPGMGSHGGGTAEGQAALLAALGVSAEAMGCDVRASMDTVTYGDVGDGVTCHFDAYAASAAAILVINRVKAHTSFPRPIESGLSKMLAVGLGKAEGARQVHKLGPRGLSEVLPRLAERVVECAPILAGLALVENAGKALMHIEAVAPRDFAEADMRLLKRSKATMARLPFKQIDGLIVETLGKDISGAGIDPAISGRTDIRGVDNPAEPFIHKVAALGMTNASHGNGIGVGMADYIPLDLANALDLRAMYMNAVSATILEKAFIPIVLPNERACINALAATAWSLGEIRLCQIASSASLDEIAVTRPLLEELETRNLALSSSGPEVFRFGAGGKLLSRLAQ